MARTRSFATFLPGLFLASISVLQALALPGPYLGREHDDVQYVLEALSLWRGRLSLGITPGDPYLTIQTPGLPVLLMPAALVSGEAAWGYHITAWAWLVLCDVLVWLWLRRRWAPREAMLGTALFALNPLVLQRAGIVMPEVPSLALLLGFLMMSDRRSWPAWATGLSLAGLWLVRPACAALFPAVWVGYALKKRWRDFAAAAAPPVVLIGAWQAWLSSLGQSVPKVEEFFLSYSTGWADVLKACASNAAYYPAVWGATWLPRPAAAGTGSLAAGVLLTAAAGRGAWLAFRRGGWSPALGWLAFGGLMHVVWPWQYDRYLIPFLPFLIDVLLVAVMDLAARLRRPSWPVPSLACLCVAAFLGQGRHFLTRGTAAAAPDLQRTYEWIRTRTAPGDAFASLYFSRDAWYTGRPFGPLPDASSAAGFEDTLRRHGIARVLMQDAGDVPSSLGARFYVRREAGRVFEVLSKPPFRKEFSDPTEGTVVYRLTAR